MNVNDHLYNYVLKTKDKIYYNPVFLVVGGKLFKLVFGLYSIRTQERTIILKNSFWKWLYFKMTGIRIKICRQTGPYGRVSQNQFSFFPNCEWSIAAFTSSILHFPLLGHPLFYHFPASKTEVNGHGVVLFVLLGTFLLHYNISGFRGISVLLGIVSNTFRTSYGKKKHENSKKKSPKSTKIYLNSRYRKNPYYVARFYINIYFFIWPLLVIAHSNAKDFKGSGNHKTICYSRP